MGELFDKEPSKKKLRVRKWNMFEVVNLDEDSDDYEYEFCEQKDLVKKRRSRVLQKPRKRKMVEVKKECLDKLRVMEEEEEGAIRVNLKSSG